MDSIEQQGIVIDEDIARRLAALAGDGRSVSDLANDVLRAFAEEAEGTVDADTAEDERRLREYERTGEAIPFDEIKAELRMLAVRSAAKAKTEA